MRYLELLYPESRFGGFSDIDGTVAFYSRVNSLLNAASTALDIGCGRGGFAEDPVPYRRALRTLKGKCARVIGIDVSPVGSENRTIDEFRQIENAHGPWPVDDGSIDLCLADSVLEHLEDPDLFFAECRRVTKPGGCVCLRTPNIRGYVGVATRLTPYRLHGRVLSRVQPGRKQEDVFPTFFKCNTPRRVKRMFSEYGFDHCVYGYDAEPSYLAFSRLAFTMGALYQRWTPKGFRTAIFGYARKGPVPGSLAS